MEAARVEQPLQALAHGEPAGRVLALHALVAAHLPGQLLAAAQLLELGLPAHGRHATGAGPPGGGLRACGAVPDRLRRLLPLVLATTATQASIVVLAPLVVEIGRDLGASVSAIGRWRAR